ncbi:hypothetical protein SteCoe_34250 [Stentor coeruleus]|uniref:MD-2-related lipid-recognition domain-containing protein n=1 Tax=Stentor coeruleus TaxID=5963 RepID=A0A1R2AUX8_9CILI|nr:hypothetical protein SteCoe_34250 [Stentor coeruleus]
MKAVAIVLCILALAQAGGMLGVGQNCDTTLTAYTVTSFNVTPWPPYKNTNMSMTMIGTMNSSQTLKSMNIYTYYKGSLLDVETVAESGTYTAGQTATINFKVYLPSIAPSGSYTVDVKLVNTSGVFLNCWQVSFTL